MRNLSVKAASVGTLLAATGQDVKVIARSNCDYSNAHWVSSLFNLCRAYSIIMIWSPHRIVSSGCPRTRCSAAGGAAAAVTLVFLKDHLDDVRGLNKHVPEFSRGPLNQSSIGADNKKTHRGFLREWQQSELQQGSDRIIRSM